MSKKVVNWGIISCARIADRAVIPGIKQAGNARLYAIAGRSRDRVEEFKARHEPVKAYYSYEELLDDPEVDAVYIPLPNSLHAEWVEKAAAGKKHVLCEKPMGINAAEEARIKEACDQNGVLLMEAFAYMHSPLTQKVKELADSGAIGQMKYIEAHFSFVLEDPEDIRYNAKMGGGSIYDLGCYTISIIRYLAGSEPISITAAGKVGEKTGVDETAAILMEFENGLTAVSFCSFKAAFCSGYRINGTKGVMEVPVPFNEKGQVKISISSESGVEEIGMDIPDNYMLEVEQFGKCILQGEKPLYSFQDSYNNARVIDEAIRQIRDKNGKI